MNKWQKESFIKLYCITNDLGLRSDLTSVNILKLDKYTQVHSIVSKVILGIMTQENKEETEYYIKQLEYLTRWNFPDKWDRLSEEEIEVNKQIEQEAKQNNIKLL